MEEQSLIINALLKLKNYIEKENYKGYDPYDALTSPVFELPFFRSNKFARFGIQQLVKRSPVNLRPLLRIKKGLNPVTLGLCIQAYTSMAKTGLIDQSTAVDKCESLIAELNQLVSAGFNGVCWGYDFPWQARYATIPAGQPTVVATGIITNGLFEYYRYSGSESAFELCKSACDFILSDLNRTVTGDGSICFSYSPFDQNCVFNASMKGARTLIQVYQITKDVLLKETAEKAVHFVINHQRKDGSWYYSTALKGNWIDNYHTGYVLDCLDEYIKISGDKRWEINLDKGFKFYLEHLFIKDYIPKFFHDRLYPLDCTSAGQAILTLCRLGRHDIASGTALYLVNQMQSPRGNFYFRKYRYFTEKHAFMRWSDAWMFSALAKLAYTLQANSNG